MIKSLHVVLRTCSRSGILSNPRYVTDSRQDMVKKCVSSLFRSINSLDSHRIKTSLTIIDDHSSDEFLEWLNKNLPLDNAQVQIINIAKQGYHRSAVEQFDYAKNYECDYVYLVEDDYFHSLSSLTYMVDHFEFLQSTNTLVGNSVAIYPYDCPDRYIRDYPEPCRIFYHENLYWRTVTKSTNTVFMIHSDFVACHPIFKILAENYEPSGNITENNTINRFYNNLVDIAGPITLFSPIPSLAVHCEHQEPTSITSGGLDNFSEYWNQYTF